MKLSKLFCLLSLIFIVFIRCMPPDVNSVDKVSWIDVRDFGAVPDDSGDDGLAIQSAISSLPITGGTIFLPNGVYRVDKGPIVFPVGKLTENYITNICIRGESSGLASGSTKNAFGTRIDFRGLGMLFDLHDANSDYICINVQFRDFEAYDRNGSQDTYGIRANTFGTGSIIENVGFKGFYQSVAIETKSYFSKLDRVTSFYARNTGIKITNPNMMDINRCQAHGTTGNGLHVIGHHGVNISNGWYESNSGYGIYVTGNKLHGVVITENYLEHNSLGGIYVTGLVDNYADGGYIAGNYQPNDEGYGSSIILGYVRNYVVIGNSVGTRKDSGSGCIRSNYCQNSIFIGNSYPAGLDIPLSVPTNKGNTIYKF